MDVIVCHQQYAGFADATKAYGADDERPTPEESPDEFDKFLAGAELRAVGIDPDRFHAQVAGLNERVAAAYRKIATQARTKTAPAEIPLEKRAKGVAKVIRTEFPASGKCVIAELDEHNAVIRTYLEN